MSTPKEAKLHTRVTHAGFNPDHEHGSVAPPIYQTSTFQFETAEQGARRFAGEETGYIYTRVGNPTVAALERGVADLEGGFDALATSTGMAAVTTMYATFLNQGDHMIGTNAMYGPSIVVVEQEFSRFGIEYDFVDTSDIEAVKAAVRPNTKLIYLETPANPTIKLTDIQACAEIAHANGAVLVVDNTFMSPVLQNPLSLGADVVLHSVTKFINGHTDVVGGILVPKTEELYAELQRVLWRFGGTMDPHQAWLVHRGLRTLALRVEKSQASAAILADYLDNHPKIEWVRYPGLKHHPQHELAKTQARGFGSMISFGVHGGVEAGRTVMNNVKLATLAVSLGGFETLIQHPASMTHAAMDPAEREISGITDGLVRISVGCEDVADIQADIENCLNMI